MKKIFVLFMVFACKTTELDHRTGDRNPTWNTLHLDKVHPLPWMAGNDTIYPHGFKPIKMKK